VAPFLETSGTLFFGVRPGWGGERRRLGPGDLILLDDTEGKGHSTRVVGSDELVIFGEVLADERAHPGPRRGASPVRTPALDPLRRTTQEALRPLRMCRSRRAASIGADDDAGRLG
jgi:hypothetical protein